MIQSFHSKEVEKLFRRERIAKIPADIQRVALRKLWMLDSAIDINDLRIPPANHLEKLRGDRSGQHSIRINDRWRLCFRWQNNQAYEVEIVDYH